MLDQLIIILRGMQLYTHNAHNQVRGATFLEDHEYLGELYGKYEAAYDGVVERMVGLGSVPNIIDTLIDTQEGAVQMLKQLPATSECTVVFSTILKLEKMLCTKIEECLRSHPYSEGTKQLLGTLADESEMRQYKIGQRIG